MTDETLPMQFNQLVEFNIPEFDLIEAQVISFTSIKEGERRIIESKIVNGGTYNELEFVMNEGYREAKKNLTLIGYNLLKTKRVLDRVKSIALIDDYADWLKKVKLKDSAAIRDAFLQTIPNYVVAINRIDMLTALEASMEGKIKVFENVCRYMRKEMDIRVRSGMTGEVYSTIK